jgi:hypothetical protein
MRRLKINYSRILVVLIIALGSCDIIKEPYLETETSQNSNIRKVLLEEFTGHQCPNCPAGSATAKKLQEFYGDKLIIISYHSGFYARTSSSFPVDYRTTDGTELDAFFKVPYYPSGMINRTSSNNTNIFGSVDWSEIIASQIRIKPDVSIQITNEYDQPGKFFRTTIKVKALRDLSYKAQLCVYLTEDNLVSSQSIAGDPSYPSGFIPDYRHMHVFRSSLNGIWGDVVFETASNGSGEKTFSFNRILDEKFIPENCSIVAFVFKENDKTILQAESVKVIK